jgi:hypothetical protein
VDKGCAIAPSDSSGGPLALFFLLPPALLIWKRRRPR